MEYNQFLDSTVINTFELHKANIFKYIAHIPYKLIKRSTNYYNFIIDVRDLNTLEIIMDYTKLSNYFKSFNGSIFTTNTRIIQYLSNKEYQFVIEIIDFEKI